MDLIEANPNPFGGVVANPAALVDDPKQFRSQLAHSLDAWEDEGYKVVWLEIPISKSALVPGAVEAGFTYHHANETDVLLTRRLEEGAVIPPYATHYIGVGGVVLSYTNEILVVSERYREYNPNRRGPAYKLPGGALQAGEHIADAAVREVLEETGVKTKFESLVCFRHWHGYRYGKSDIYFVCRLHPLSEEINIQEEEIAVSRWMPVGDYLAAENVSDFNKRIVRAAMESPGLPPTTIDGYGDPERYEFFMPLAEEMPPE